MDTEQRDTASSNDPEALLERAFIVEYLRNQGYNLEQLHTLTRDKVKQLMIAASTYACSRLTEVEARAHFMKEVHGVAPPL